MIAYIHFNHDVINGLIGWSDIRNSSWDINYGDMLVCASIVRQVSDCGNLIDGDYRCEFGGTLPKQADRAIIRGSTYLHHEFDYDTANKTIDSIISPLAIVGLGAQSPALDISFLDNNNGARDFIARLNEKSASISVRGDFSACIVERLGGKNIRITGCPSLFYSLKVPKVNIPEMLHRPERTLGISIHTELMDNMYCNSPEVAKKLHGALISFGLNNSLKLSIFEQGVLNEFNVADRNLLFADRFSSAQRIIKDIDTEGSLTEYQLMACLVSVATIDEWIAKARDLDAMIGFRFHGNMMALLHGKPAYYYYYDSRIEEFCNVYKLPGQDVNSSWKSPIVEMQEHDWDATNTCIQNCFKELNCFYHENNFNVNF